MLNQGPRLVGADGTSSPQPEEFYLFGASEVASSFTATTLPISFSPSDSHSMPFHGRKAPLPDPVTFALEGLGPDNDGKQ